MIGRFSFLVPFLLVVFSAKSQYYYKDILLTRQNQANWALLRDQKLHRVDIQSLDANDELTPGFVCTQSITSDFSSISTITKSANTPASELTTYYAPGGRLVKTIDTSDSYNSTTEYGYNENGGITSLVNTSVETDNHIAAVEKHIWVYEGTQLTRMIKIRGDSDTTLVSLIKDEKGNIIEEKPVRAGLSLPSVYYYYDSSGRLTDIVRYNQKAQRLLPDYVFEYHAGLLSAMLFVPNGSADYQRWIYTYTPDGLKATETCYDKKRQIVVKIRYTYSAH